MANKVFLDATAVALLIKRTGDADYVPFGCFTDNGFDASTATIDTSTKCSNGFGSSRSGQKTWTMSGTLSVFDENLYPDMKSAQTLGAIWVSGEVVAVKMANPDGTFYVAGDALLTSYKLTANNNTDVTCQITLTGVDEPILEAPTT